MTMRLLLVEDDPEIVRVFEAEFPAGEGIELTTASNRQSALGLVDSTSFDLVVCDLRIPSAEGTDDEGVAHGRAVLTRLLRPDLGTPVLAFSAYGTLELVQDLMKEAKQEDFLGEGTPRGMLRFLRKDELPGCINEVRSVETSIDELDQIELAFGLVAGALRWEHTRILRIYARRLGAHVIRLSPLAGGLSGSQVVRVRLERAGVVIASVVAKLDAIPRIEAEHRKVEEFVAPRLAPGSFPSAVTPIRAGAGSQGGLFYRFAGAHDRSLFDALESTEVTMIVGRLRTALEPWHESGLVERVPLSELRADLVDLGDVRDGLRPAELADESMTLSVRRSAIHGDLHVFNVLLSAADAPLMIDFGLVHDGSTAIDPITLELCPIFHPDAQAGARGWPSVDQAANWDDLDVYLENCPFPDFVRACRDWAFGVAAGDLQVFAAVYACALRQLKFPDTPHDLAAALVSCAVRRLNV